MTHSHPSALMPCQQVHGNGRTGNFICSCHHLCCRAITHSVIRRGGLTSPRGILNFYFSQVRPAHKVCAWMDGSRSNLHFLNKVENFEKAPACRTFLIQAHIHLCCQVPRLPLVTSRVVVFGRLSLPTILCFLLPQWTLTWTIRWSSPICRCCEMNGLIVMCSRVETLQPLQLCFFFFFLSHIALGQCWILSHP